MRSREAKVTILMSKLLKYGTLCFLGQYEVEVKIHFEKKTISA